MRNKELFTLAVAFLMQMAQATKFSTSLNEYVVNGEATLDPHTLLVRKNISGASSNYDFIDAQTEKVAGISTLQGTTLPKGQALIAHGISISYAVGALADGPGAQDYTAAVPAIVRNAHLLIKQNGREVINEPVSNFLKGEATANSMDYYFDTPSFRYLVDDESIEIKLVFPTGTNLAAATAADNHFLELRILGQKTNRKV